MSNKLVEKSNEKAQVISTGYEFVKDGISMRFQADVLNKKIVISGKQSISLTVDEAYQLHRLIGNMILVINPGDDQNESKLEKGYRFLKM